MHIGSESEDGTVGIATRKIVPPTEDEVEIVQLDKGNLSGVNDRMCSCFSFA